MPDIENKIIENDKPINEPIFKNTPIGVLTLLSVIALVHLFRWLNQGEAMALWTRNYAASSIEIWLFLTGQAERPFHTIGRLIVHQFLHSGSFHIIMNSAMLLQIGPMVEIALNRGANILTYPQSIKRGLKIKGAILMIGFFIVCGICGAFGLAALNSKVLVQGIGASGAICGIYGGYLWSIYNMTPKGEPVFKEIFSSALVFLVINVGLAALARMSEVIPIAWEAHLFGFIGGVLFFPFFRFLSRKI